MATQQATEDVDPLEPLQGSQTPQPVTVVLGAELPAITLDTALTALTPRGHSFERRRGATTAQLKP
jgi:hypothetical protein